MQLELTLAVAVSIASLVFTIFTNSKKNDKELFVKLGVITEKLENLQKIITAQFDKNNEIFSRLVNLERETDVQKEQINALKADLRNHKK
jgi:formiminotetrahydrofolate cyclodeaminase